jgi:hypothetical protein
MQQSRCRDSSDADTLFVELQTQQKLLEANRRFWESSGAGYPIFLSIMRREGPKPVV